MSRSLMLLLTLLGLGIGFICIAQLISSYCFTFVKIKNGAACGIHILHRTVLQAENTSIKHLEQGYTQIKERPAPVKAKPTPAKVRQAPALKYNCNNYNLDPNRTYTVTYNALNNSVSHMKDSLVMVTHMTGSRLYALERLVNTWKGAISVSVYESNSNIEFFLRQYRAKQELEKRQNIYIHYVQANRTYYPGNVLRNTALEFTAPAAYVFLNDIDLVPTAETEDEINKRIKDGTVTTKQAMILPAFQAMNFNTTIPLTKSELLQQWKDGSILPFMWDFYKLSHNVTDFTKWTTAAEPYEVKYQEKYEPYVIMLRNETPRFDERFVGYYYDKISFVMMLNQLGFRLVVDPNAFLTHLYHKRSDSRSYLGCAKLHYETYKKELKADRRSATGR